MMFSEGDRVVINKCGTRGKFMEEYAGVAYLELDNGVEMDCSTSAITLEADYKTPEEIKQEEAKGAITENQAIAELILPQITTILLTMAEQYAEQVVLSIGVIGGTATPWDKLTAYHKMNFICVVTNTRFSDWVKVYNNKRTASFQMTIFAAIADKFIK